MEILVFSGIISALLKESDGSLDEHGESSIRNNFITFWLYLVYDIISQEAGIA